MAYPPAVSFDLFEDRQGALWIGTEGSVARYSNGRFETLHARSGAAAIETFYEDREGNLWLGTDAAGFWNCASTLHHLHDRRRPSQRRDSHPLGRTKTASGRERMAMGSPIFRGSAWQTLTTQQGLASNTILSARYRTDDALRSVRRDGLDHLMPMVTPDPHRIARPCPTTSSAPCSTTPRTTRSLWIGSRRGLAHRTP